MDCAFPPLSKLDVFFINIRASYSAMKVRLEEWSNFDPHVLRHEHKKIKADLPSDIDAVFKRLGDNYGPTRRLENWVTAYERHQRESVDMKTYFVQLEAYREIYAIATNPERRLQEACTNQRASAN